MPTDDPRPEFARDFPRAPSLDALVESFSRGDYARVRTEGRLLAGSESEDESVRRAARTLVSRTEPDPLAVWLLALTAALLVALSAYWVVHAKAPAPRTPTTSLPTPPA